MAGDDISRRGRPPVPLTRFQRAFQFVTGGGNTRQAAAISGMSVATFNRRLRNDPDLRAKLDAARAAGRAARGETNTMSMTTTTEDPVALLEKLQRDRAHLALDALEGRPGARDRLLAVEGRLSELRQDLERQQLAEAERERRQREAAEREQANALKAALKRRSDLQAEQRKAFAEVERLGFTFSEAVGRALALDDDIRATYAEVAALSPDDDVANTAYYAGSRRAVSDRCNWFLKKAGAETPPLLNNAGREALV